MCWVVKPAAVRKPRASSSALQIVGVSTARKASNSFFWVLLSMISSGVRTILRRPDQGPKGRVEGPSLHNKPHIVEARSLDCARDDGKGLVQRERKILLVDLLVSAVGHHLAERLVDGVAQLGVFLAQAGGDADAQRLVVLDVLADQLAAFALGLLAPQPELRLVAEHRVDLVVGQRRQGLAQRVVALELGGAAEALVGPVGMGGIALHADPLVAQQ